MSAKSSGVRSARKMREGARRTGRKAAFSPLMQTLTRVGYGVRGVIYIIIGVLALSFVFMHRGVLTDQKGAIAAIGKQPLGMVFLWIVVIGLVSYSLWGLTRAFYDPLQKGKDHQGLLKRAGFLGSAIAYGLLVPFTLGLISGGSAATAQGSGGNRQLLASVMSAPGGRILVGLIGVIVLAIAAFQIYTGISAHFDKDYKTYKMSAREIHLASRMGRLGYVARGIVFAVVGILICSAAVQSNSRQPIGFDAALAAMLKQPYGVWVLGIVALGLIAFGVFSFMTMLWFRARVHS